MYKQIILISLIASLALASSVTFESLNSLWQTWKVHHNKGYATTEEEANRFAIFADNYAKIEKYNAEHEMTKLAINKFSDLTGKEFKRIYSGCGLYESNNNLNEEDYATFDTSNGLADQVDWRLKGAVTPVKNQGQCGSCWSFSTTGVVESYHAISTGSLVSLSEQQILDCNFITDHGCNGGLPSNALTYVARFGLETEEQYPYQAQRSRCSIDKTETVQYISGHKAVTPNSLTQMKAAVATMPVSIGVEADEDVFHHYSSGVVTTGCGASLDHAVLLVGYTTVKGTEAFIVKNSWGPDWGQDGYILISTDPKANDGQGVCGILANGVVVSG